MHDTQHQSVNYCESDVWHDACMTDTPTTDATDQIWRKIPGGHVVHLLSPHSAGCRTQSRCGVTPIWYQPIGWKEPEDGEVVRQCRRCLKFAAQDLAPRG